MMLKIGVTGGIGSGKTTVCRVFETLGIPVFYADDEAKLVMTADAELVAAIKKTFGEDSYDASGQLNRAHLASLVFNDELQLAKLNSFVHPAVFRAFDRWVEAREGNYPYILKEAALLFESDSYKYCDYKLLVVSPEADKIARVMNRDGLSEVQVRARMDKQLTDEQKREMADFVISNTVGQSLILQVMALHRRFLKECEASR